MKVIHMGIYERPGNITGKIENTWFATLLSWVLPALLFFSLWAFLMRRLGPQQGLMSIGKSKAKVYMEKSTGVTFKDVVSIDEAKAGICRKWCIS